MRCDPRRAAIAAIALAGLYLVASLVTGHRASAEPPPDLAARAAEAGLDPLPAAVMLGARPGAVLIDRRSPEQYAQWHIPGALNVPKAGPDELRELAGTHPVQILVAAKDDVARDIVAKARASETDDRFYYLKDGPRGWYLLFELPVPMFSADEPPPGWQDAMAVARDWLATPDRPAPGPDVEAALRTLGRLTYQPGLLKSQGKPAGGGRKKIAGGCG